MTIATKNGVPIVKDGVVASNCGCCVGWYCCDDRLFDDQCRVTSLGALVGVSVTIDAQDYKKVVAFLNGKCYDQFGNLLPHTLGVQNVGITLGSHLSGTFQLSPQFVSGNNTSATWLYTHTIQTPDAVGCTGYSIQVTVISECVIVGGVLGKRLRITQAYGTHMAYQWSKQKAGAPPTDSVTVADMACMASSSGPGACPDASGVSTSKIPLQFLPFPDAVVGESYVDIIIPGPCRPSQTIWSRQYQGMLFDHPFVPPSDPSLGPLYDSVVVSEEGSNMFVATTTVTLQ